ncbi:ATP-binding protein [Vibrio sp. JC009]|uniref:AAA family ATPase n=1 Tax=Vibrio sp. JC009 TaxID=2912314 RepID=UPI0023B0A279|nr:ATP-binding protein [Vibrio sp. JC009]WED22828.1 ATP-binding protein [Vibrio sp. JC009]
MQKLILIRGVSGSGKSTLAKKIQSEQPGAAIVEADMYFCDQDGTYQYDRDDIKLAHQWCQSETTRLLRQGKTVIVSNTFCRQWEIQFYLDQAKKKGITVELHHCYGRYQNVHGVPDEVVEKQLESFEKVQMP